jgi:hypothetical protein
MMPYLTQFLILYTNCDRTTIRKLGYLDMDQRIILIWIVSK